MSESSLNALARLNEIGAAINKLSLGDSPSDALETLGLIVESAVDVVSGSSAVIYTYNEQDGGFDLGSRVSAEGLTRPVSDDAPRPDGFGMLAVRERRRVLSYEETDLSIHPEKVTVGAKVMIGYPLIVFEEVLGVLYLYLHEDRPLTKLELLMLDNFVHHAAMALYVTRQMTFAQERELRKGKELRRLRRAGMLISSRSNLQDTLEAILRMALEVMDAQYGIFRLVDKSGQHLVTRAFVGEGLDHPILETLPISRTSIMGTVALEREPLVISDLREPPFCHIYYPLDSGIEMRSELAVPLVGASGRLEGVLNFESPVVNAFTKQDRYILEILATQAVVAIQEARLLDALQDLSNLLLTHTRQEVLDKIVKWTCELLNVQVGLVWLIQEQQLVLHAASDGHLHGERLDINSSLTGKVILTGLPVMSYDVSKDTRFGLKSFARRYGWGSALIVPIIASDSPVPLGALSIYTTQPFLRNFEEAEWEKKVLSLLGYYAALAVQNAARLDELRAVQEKRAIAETFAAVGDIASNLLHRLNNKVGTIPVRIEGIQDKLDSLLHENPYLASNLVEIERSAAEAMEIVRENVFHLRPITLAPVSIVAGVREAIRSVQPQQVTIESRGLENLPWVQADQKRLTLLFVNLLENAISAMNGQGRVCFAGDSDENWVTITVSDTGPGIASEIQEKIFEFTYSTREHPGKLGFGLWWVKTLMTRFGGTASVDSDGKSGSTFILKFPKAPEEK